jgi:hypothetical protein
MLQLIQRGIACIEKVNHAHGDIINKLDTLSVTLADIKKKCDEGGFRAVCKKYFPDIPEKTAYHKAKLGSMTALQLSDFRVKRANEEAARRKAEKAKKEAADAKAASDAAELAKLKAGTAPATLIQNGKAHPDPATPLVLHGSDSKSGKPGTVTTKRAVSGDNKDQKDAALTSFARLVSDLFSLTAGGVKPDKFVKADVKNGTLEKVAELLLGVVAVRRKAAAFAEQHNQSAEQSADRMRAAHAANENAAAPAAAA